MDGYKNGFTFLQSYYEALKELPAKVQAEVLMAMCRFHFEEEEPALTGTSLAVFRLIRPMLEKSRERSKAGRNKSQSNDEQNTIKAQSNSDQNYNRVGVGVGVGGRERVKENTKRKFEVVTSGDRTDDMSDVLMEI